VTSLPATINKSGFFKIINQLVNFLRHTKMVLPWYY
jgi:hypothetical protein